LADNEYSNVIRTYCGEGRLKLIGGDELPCCIAIQQIEIGLILIICKLMLEAMQITSVLKLLMGFSPTEDVGCIYGTTDEGLNFKSQGKLCIAENIKNPILISMDGNRPTVIKMVARNRVSFWKENQCHVKQYKFSVVNFEFKGNCPAETVIHGDKQVERYPLELNTSWAIAILNPIPDYDYVIRKAKAQKSISVTRELIAKPSEALGLDVVINKINELCRLLSLAWGTKVNWISVEEYIEDGQACKIVLKNESAANWPFSCLPLIDPRSSQDTQFYSLKKSTLNTLNYAIATILTLPLNCISMLNKKRYISKQGP